MIETNLVKNDYNMIQVRYSDFCKLSFVGYNPRRARSLKKIEIVDDDNDVVLVGYYRPDNDTLQVYGLVYRFILIQI